MCNYITHPQNSVLNVDRKEIKMTERVKRLTLSVSEAAEELGISSKTCYNLVHVQGFPVTRIGNRIRISRGGLQEWVRANEGKTVEVQW